VGGTETEGIAHCGDHVPVGVMLGDEGVDGALIGPCADTAYWAAGIFQSTQRLGLGHTDSHVEVS
jgi:hypothetical protein